MTNKYAIVVYNKTDYHHHINMIDWCRASIGDGGWTLQRDIAPGDLWSVDSMFGITTFMFISNELMDRFLLEWNVAHPRDVYRK